MAGGASHLRHDHNQKTCLSKADIEGRCSLLLRMASAAQDKSGMETSGVIAFPKCSRRQRHFQVDCTNTIPEVGAPAKISLDCRRLVVVDQHPGLDGVLQGGTPQRHARHLRACGRRRQHQAQACDAARQLRVAFHTLRRRPRHQQRLKIECQSLSENSPCLDALWPDVGYPHHLHCGRNQ